MKNILQYKKDFKPSIVVFLVALPLCLGIALASGAPLMSGILSGIIGGLVVGLISNSSTSVSGPAAGLTVIVLSAINTLGDFYIFTVAVFLAGLIQIALGFAKAGRIGGYFPSSVIKGMLAAIGIILILKQIPHALGFDSDFMGDEAFKQHDGGNTFSTLFKAMGAFELNAVIIALLCLVALFFWDTKKHSKNKFFEYIPAPLFVVAIGIFLNEVVFPNLLGTKLDGSHVVSLPVKGGFTSFLGELKFPDWSALTNVDVYKIAITLAIVGSLETMLSIEAVDKLDPQKNITNKDREFIAQGVGNMTAGLIGALPLTSVIVRSSANISSGAKSKASTILHGAWILIAVVFMHKILELIPLAALAAILIHVGFKLINPSLFKKLLKHGNVEFVPFVVTIVAILFTDLLVGIMIGMLVGFAFIILEAHRKSIIMVNEGNNYLIRFLKDVSFLNKPEMSKLLNDIPRDSNITIDGTNHVYVDNDIVLIIEDFIEAAEERGVRIEVLKSRTAVNPFFKGTQ